MKKKWFSIFIVALLINISVYTTVTMVGCDSTTDQRLDLTRQTTSQAQDVSTELTKVISDLEAGIASAKDSIASGDLPDEYKAELSAQVALAEGKLNKYNEYKDRIDESLANLNSAANSGDEGKTLETGVREVAKFLPQPYGIYLALASPLIGWVGAFIGKLSEKKKAKKTMTALVASVNDGLSAIDEKTTDVIKAKLKSSQTASGIRNEVQKTLLELDPSEKVSS